MQRADALEGCLEGSEEEVELTAITDAIEAGEAVHWPLGRTQDGLASRSNHALGGATLRVIAGQIVRTTL